MGLLDGKVVNRHRRWAGHRRTLLPWPRRGRRAGHGRRHQRRRCPRRSRQTSAVKRARRRRRRAQRPGHGRGHRGTPIGRDRRADQQRGHLHRAGPAAEALRRDLGRRVGPCHGRERARHVAVLQCGGAGHASAAQRVIINISSGTIFGGQTASRTTSPARPRCGAWRGCSRASWADIGVRVNSITPGLTSSEMVQEIYPAEILADRAQRASSNASRNRRTWSAP